MPTIEQELEEEEVTPVNTPPAVSNEEEPNEFARLTPSNRLARLAFSQVVELILHDPDVLEHANKFISFNEVTEEDAVSDLSEVEATGGARAPSPPTRLWSGYYVLDLKVPPRHPPVGWVLGCMSSLGRADGVDLLLAPKHNQYRIGSKHARLTLQRDTGCLLVSTGGRTVSVTASFGTTRLKNGVRALTEAVSLSIGDLQFNLQYQNTQSYQQDLENFMRNELGNASFELSNSLSSLGSDADTQLKDYTIKETFAAGTSAMVSGGIVKATGQYVAVKKMRRSSREDPTIEAETAMLNTLHQRDHHPRICRIRETIVNGPIGETYIIYEPFLYAELYKVMRSLTLSDSARVSICQQLLEALTWIHGQGAMHRDLKPQNMGLKSSNPPEAIIFDFGHATFETSSVDHYKGTIWYLAPEVLNLKYRRATLEYDSGVDVWAMGLTLYELICQGSKWRGQKLMLDRRGRPMDYNLDRMKEVNFNLERSLLLGPANIVQAMLEVDPRRRITAEEAYEKFKSQSSTSEAHSQDSSQMSSKRMKMSQ